MNFDTLFYSIVLGFMVLSLFWLYKIIQSYYWIRKASIATQHNSTRNLFVVIPALHESKRLKETINYFRRTFSHLKKLKIIIVTTEAEYQYNSDQKSNTIIIAKELYQNYSNVIHYHDPHLGGKMAHQLNYAIKEMISKNSAKDALFAIYNADSRPHPNTFDWVLSYLEKNKNAKVFQQYGDYTQNINRPGKILTKPLLWSAACWQNRWSIGFEVPHALKQFKNGITAFSYPLNYCIGHGLFLTSEIFEKLGGFSEETHNEDAIFGLELSYIKEQIVPIPYFDLSDTPDSISGLYLQKSNWFFGPLEAFMYFKKIVKKSKNTVNKFRLLILSSKLFLHAVYWIVGPTLVTTALIIALVNFSIWKIIFLLITLTFFLTFPNFLSWFLIRKNSKRKITPKQVTISFLHNLLGGFPCYFLHGLSAYRTLIKITTSRITKKPIAKERTPMIQS